MNILPKKKWHVRTKENVARVRRDQKLAAETEQHIKERAQLAEQQFKVNLLRKNAERRGFALCGTGRNETTNGDEEIHLEDPSGHVNLFAELEEEDRKNLGATNKEYEEEKRKEQEEYESKVGILKYLAEGSNELMKQKSWYEQLPSKRLTENQKETKSTTKTLPSGVMDFSEAAKEMHKKKKKKEKSERKHKKKRRKIYSSSSDDKRSKRRRQSHRNDSSTEHSSSSDDSTKRYHHHHHHHHHHSHDGNSMNDKLQKLRQERMEREEAERKRVFDLLHPLHTQKNEQKLVPKYSSQFNPELARQNRPH